MKEQYKLITQDAIHGAKAIPENSIQCIITSPPYYQIRDYKHPKQIGLEQTPEEYVTKLVKIFTEIRKSLKDNGTLIINIDDTYNSGGQNRNGIGNNNIIRNNKYIKETRGFTPSIKTDTQKKSLLCIPELFTIAMIKEEWILRNKIIWQKPNPFPNSAKDRYTHAWEYIYLFSKNQTYYANKQEMIEPAKITTQSIMKTPKTNATGKNADAYKQGIITNKSNMNMNTSHTQFKNGQPMRSKRDIMKFRPSRNNEIKHYATFPLELPTEFIKTFSKPNDIILDPFSGAGTTGIAAIKLKRKYIGIDTNEEYNKIANKRLKDMIKYTTIKLGQ